MRLAEARAAIYAVQQRRKRQVPLIETCHECKSKIGLRMWKKMEWFGTGWFWVHTDCKRPYTTYEEAKDWL